MTLPQPVAGLVVQYDFVWRRDFEAGRQSSKVRPCCVAIALNRGDKTLVRYFPITHSPPGPQDVAVELPADEKHRIGLDDRPSWIIVNQTNEDRWPDGITTVPGPDQRLTYGILKKRTMIKVAALFARELKARRVTNVDRQGE